jgi:hypothetical protein
MEEARILHCESDEEIRKRVVHILSTHEKHRVVAVAETLGQALKQLDNVKEKKLGANVVLLSSNVSGGSFTRPLGYIAEKSSQTGRGIPVVGLSPAGLEQFGLREDQELQADLTVDDAENDTGLLIRTLDGLPEPY